jgi:hypothetical protein
MLFERPLLFRFGHPSPRVITPRHSSHGSECGERVGLVKDVSFARAGVAGVIARCLRRAFFRTPYVILDKTEPASPIMPAVR